MDFPSKALEKLACNNCKHHLSIFPIYTYPGKGSYCGNCTLHNEEINAREIAYECIAQSLYFPCKNKEMGCQKRLLPAEVKGHESACHYAGQTCLWCKKVIKTSELLAHCRKKHPEIICSKRFVIDSNISGRLDYLILTKHQLFLLCAWTVSDHRKVYFRVQPLIFYQNVKFSCTISRLKRYKSRNRSISFEIVGGPVEANLPFLSSPGAVYQVNINEIIKNPCTFTNNVKNKNLLDVLMCSNCKEYMTPPIFQCDLGDNICKHCKEIPICVVCTSKINSARNFSLEALTEFVNYFCKYESCKMILNVNDKEDHEKFCDFAEYKCLMDGCICYCNNENIRKHLLRNHAKYVLESSLVTFYYTEAAVHEYFFLERGAELFKLVHKFTKMNFYFDVQYVGEKKFADNFMFSLHIYGDDHEQITREQKCNTYLKTEETFDEATTFLEFPFSLVERFISNRCLKYHIFINRI